MTKYDKNDKIHVENLQERHFLEIKKSNAKNHTGLGWGGGIGGLLISLLIANALTQPPTQPPYSRGLLKAPEGCLLINYCKTPPLHAMGVPFATLFPKCQYSDRSICNIGTQMSIFISIHLQHWYPNVNIRIDPFATLVPKLAKSIYTYIDYLLLMIIDFIY